MAKAGIVYIGTTDGIITLSDPGATGRWRRVGQTLSGEPIAAIVAVDALTLSVRANGRGLLSSDGGQSWEESGNLGPEPVGLQAATASGVPVAVANPRLAGATAYAQLGGKEPVLLGAGAGGSLLFRSLDDGIHWQPAAAPSLSGQIHVIAPAAYHIDYAWAGTSGGDLLLSSDRGQNWAFVLRELPPILSLVVVRLI